VRRAILDKFVRVGERATIGEGERSADPALAWLDGLTLVGKDATIPDGAHVAPEVVIGVGASEQDFAAGPLEPGARTADRLEIQGLA
jgi:glucose-1-phosphate adenylyltransferase